jgi:excisionase family DNA binding protein
MRAEIVGLQERVKALPLLSTADEVADLLRTTRLAIYAMAARGQIPGVTRIGRRVLFRTEELLDWLDQKRTPSPGGVTRR